MEVYEEQGHVNNDVNCVLIPGQKNMRHYSRDIMLMILTVLFIFLPLGDTERMESEQHGDIDMSYNKDIEEKEVKFIL